MNRQDGLDVNYLSKVIKQSASLNYSVTEEQIREICRKTNMDEMALLKSSLKCLLSLLEYNAKQSARINKAEDELKVLKEEVKVLRNQKVVSREDLRMCRMKNGAVTNYRYDASKELVNYYASKGLSNEEIAKELNISKSTVWRRKKEHERAVHKLLGLQDFTKKG